jgi:hypothetical protein
VDKGAPEGAKLFPQLAGGSFQLPDETLPYWLQVGWQLGLPANVLGAFDQIDLSVS